MKKAKEYAQDFNAAENKILALNIILKSFLQETVDIAKQRNVEFSEAALISVFKEQDLKWKAFVRLADKFTDNNDVCAVSPDGYKRHLKEKFNIVI